MEMQGSLVLYKKLELFTLFSKAWSNSYLILIQQNELIVLFQGHISLSTRIFIENITSCLFYLKAFQTY